MMPNDLFGPPDDENEPESVTPAPDILGEWYVANLEDRMYEDPAFAGRDETIADLAAIYAGSTAHWIQIKPVLQGAKILADIMPKIRKLAGPLHVAAPEDDSPAVLIADAVEDAPCAPGCRVPAGWEIRKHRAHGEAAIYKTAQRKHGDGWRTERVPVAADPLVISAITRDIDTGETGLELAYLAGRSWIRHTISRGALASPRGLAEALAGRGFPVHGNNARAVLQWLVDFECANIHLLDRIDTAAQMGWHRENTGFLVGRHWIGGGDPVQFCPPDVGEAHLVKCLEPRGTMQGWREAVSVLGQMPATAQIAVYASLAPPLLGIVGAPNHVIEWCFKTSHGKTIALQLAASVWGDPDTNSPTSLIASWDMTDVGFERRAAAMSHMPLIVDDTKRARSVRGESVVPRVIYEIANGQGRSRGSVRGTRATQQWRTVMLTTGEQRAIDFDKSGGTVLRCLEIWAAPFGPTSHATAGLLRGLRSGVCSHYGHAGRAFVDRLTLEDPETICGAYRRFVALLADDVRELGQAGLDASVVDRIAAYLAIIALARDLAHEWLDLPWEPAGWSDLIATMCSSLPVVDREILALEDVASVLQQRADAIAGSPAAADRPPSGGWIGGVESSVSRPWSELWIHPVALRDMLSAMGYEYNAILAQWRERGWIVSDGDRMTTKRSIDGVRVRVVSVTRGALDAVGFGLDDTTHRVNLFDGADL